MIASRTPRQQKRLKAEPAPDEEGKGEALEGSACFDLPRNDRRSVGQVHHSTMDPGPNLSYRSSPHSGNRLSDFHRNPRFRNMNEQEVRDPVQYPRVSLATETAGTGRADVQRRSGFPQRHGHLPQHAVPQRALWSSWTAASAGGSEQEGAIWRRHFRDPAGAVQAPAGPRFHANPREQTRPASLTQADHQNHHQYHMHRQPWPLQHRVGVSAAPVAGTAATVHQPPWHWQRTGAASGFTNSARHRSPRIAGPSASPAGDMNPQPQGQRWSNSSHTSANPDRATFSGAKSSTMHANVRFHEHSVNSPSKTVPQGQKRLLSPQEQQQLFKKAKGFDMLDLLCTATLQMGELQNHTGCSCPKSKCVALYCDCFKAGRRCDPEHCSCLDCKNTVAESGSNGARTKAIRCILARNPRAFTTAGQGNPSLKLPPGEIACNCVRSRCLKLYCTCFHNSKVCKPGVCTCVGCHNTAKDDEGHREAAIRQALQKRPDAFKIKTKEKGLGCACKNNRCIRKYCECFRTGLSCTDKCTCRQCENRGGAALSSHDSNHPITLV